MHNFTQNGCREFSWWTAEQKEDLGSSFYQWEKQTETTRWYDESVAPKLKGHTKEFSRKFASNFNTKQMEEYVNAAPMINWTWQVGELIRQHFGKVLARERQDNRCLQGDRVITVKPKLSPGLNIRRSQAQRRTANAFPSPRADQGHCIAIHPVAPTSNNTQNCSEHFSHTVCQVKTGQNTHSTLDWCSEHYGIKKQEILPNSISERWDEKRKTAASCAALSVEWPTPEWYVTLPHS